jgi:hypothetical protein
MFFAGEARMEGETWLIVDGVVSTAQVALERSTERFTASVSDGPRCEVLRNATVYSGNDR